MENKKYICKYCGKGFTNANALGGHVKGCELNPNRFKIFKELKCQYCGKIIKNNHSALLSHEKSCQYNPLNEELYKPYEYQGICERCKKTFIKVYDTKKKYLEYKSHERLPKYCSKVCIVSNIVGDKVKDKIEETNEDTNYSSKYKYNYSSKMVGGYRRGSGCGKSGWYKGIHCDSSWELAFVIYHLDNNLKIERCKEKRTYIFNNEIHTYIPDFVTEEGIIEIKGYRNEMWDEKQKQNPDIKVFYKKDMESYIKYAIEKYGINFIHLYDDKDNKTISLEEKDITWFYKVNNENKTYINAFVMNKEDFNYYINNGWCVGRVPINVFADYKNVRYKVDKSYLKKMKKDNRERYLSSLLL